MAQRWNLSQAEGRIEFSTRPSNKREHERKKIIEIHEFFPLAVSWILFVWRQNMEISFESKFEKYWRGDTTELATLFV